MLWSYIGDLELNMHKAERAVLYVTISVMEKINIEQNIITLGVGFSLFIRLLAAQPISQMASFRL